MQTTVWKDGEFRHVLEVSATEEDLAADVKKALRAKRAGLQMKGFRHGRVPLHLVKRMYGKVVAAGVAESLIKEVYADIVTGSDDYDVLGAPSVTMLEYEMDGDLSAEIEFMARPEIPLVDLGDQVLERVIHVISDEDVDVLIAAIRTHAALLRPLDDEAIEADDSVVCDLREVDAGSRTLIIGGLEEDVEIDLADVETPKMAALKQAALGAQVGDTVFFQTTPENVQAHLVEVRENTPSFQATIKEGKRRDIPELDADFIREFTSGAHETEETFRQAVKEKVRERLVEVERMIFFGDIKQRMLSLHPLRIPEVLIEPMVQGGRSEPEDEERPPNRSDAAEALQWWLIRDAVSAEANLELTDEDLTHWFAQMSERYSGPTPEQLRQMYDRTGRPESAREAAHEEKVLDHLAEKFEVVRNLVVWDSSERQRMVASLRPQEWSW